MFTGIIEEQGEILHVERKEEALSLRIKAETVLEGVQFGDSIAVNGICLTVTGWGEQFFDVDVMKVTLDHTSLGDIQSILGSPVNLERAVAAGHRLGGHIVQGHVDGVAELLSIQQAPEWSVLRFRLYDPSGARYLTERGSIAVNGTSLTVSAVSEPQAVDPWFEVSLIPTTLSDTMLGTIQIGDKVNIEYDVLAKYVERLEQCR